MSEQKIEKLDMQSADLTARNIAKIAELFPSVVTETRSEDGTVQQGIDFDALRQELSDHVVEGPQERYQLDWPGKRAAKLAANAPISKTLRPDRDESVDFDTTKNLFIEGDNLDALKLLQESYLGKVKLMFADPPYNTGNDFVYNDDFAESAQEYLERSGQVDDEGNRMVANKDTSGRFHSDWLSMMYPRLKLARDLLASDGVFFMTIGDDENANLKSILDEIFGPRNFVGTFCWQSRTSISDDQEISPNHNFILVYARDRKNLRFWGDPLNPDDYMNPDNDVRGPWKLVPLDANKPGGDTYYEIVNPQTGASHYPPEGRSWAINRASMQDLLEDGRVKFGLKGDSAPKRKLYLNERIARGDSKTPSSVLLSAGTTKDGSAEIQSLFGSKKIFDYPKPTLLLKRLIEFGTRPNEESIVMDFFAGSATTGHAVMAKNAADGGNRKFVLVQFPEIPTPKSEALKQGYETISAVSRERLRRAAEQLRARFGSNDFDGGFRALTIDSTNMRETHYSPEKLGQLDLEAEVDAVKADRTAEDLLFQVLLDWGLELSVSIEQKVLAGGLVFDVDHGALLTCFDSEVSLASVRAMAQEQPARLVFRDSAFATDSDRINAQQLVSELTPGTDLKTV